MKRFWQGWLPSTKHGVARGVALYGSPGFRDDRARLTYLLSNCQQLRLWAREQQVELDDSPDSLAALDTALDLADEDMRRALANDCGLYLGTVIVSHQLRARWQIWPNGHPVVRLPSGRELDVVDAVRVQALASQPSLAALYSEADHGPPS